MGIPSCKDCIHHEVCYHIEHYGRDLESTEPCNNYSAYLGVKVKITENNMKQMLNEVLIRCKDCERYDINRKACMYYSVIWDRDDDFIFKAYPDDYCSSAIRREE